MTPLEILVIILVALVLLGLALVLLWFAFWALMFFLMLIVGLIRIGWETAGR